MFEVIEFWILTGDGRRHWVARFFDQRDGQFYAGEGATPWEAVAWSLDERAHRRLGIVRMTQTPGARPTLDVSEKLVTARVQEAERVVRLPLVEAPCTKSKSAAARRARSKKSGAKPGASH